MSEAGPDSQNDTAQPKCRPLCDRLLPLFAGLGALLLLILIAINLILMPELDQKLEQAVRREFLLADDADVSIRRGSLAQTLRGYLPNFTVKSQHAVIDELPVEDLQFAAHGIDFNMRGILNGDKAELSDLRHAELSISVREEDLQGRILPLLEEEGLQEPMLTIEADGVKLSAKKKNKLFGKVKLSARGRFVADGTDTVRFELSDLELGQINVGISGLGLDFAEALPVLDMGGFAGEVMVDEVHTSLGYLHVTAHTEGPGRQAKSSAP